MSTRDELRREVTMLRERISEISSASLRISESLDLEAVLHEVVENARSLTGTRYGAIATIDETGRPQDFITSGLTDEEHRRIVDWPDGPRLFEYFRDLPGAMKLPDVTVYVHSLGFASERLPTGNFLGMPMRHRGVHVGNFYLMEKEAGGEFTSEDEEVLVLFASQAAAAIANARAHRDEKRARTNLEALVDASPVGVVVFEAETGHMLSLNREAKRIVDSLRMPGCTVEALLEVITCRRADGREITLDRRSLSQALYHSETVRSEEIVLSVPDGRNVTTLVNATPIHSEQGEVVSLVVTMQDLAPFQELERMRTEFFGMVSHELRAPLTSIKGSASTLLESSPDLDPAEMNEFYRIILAQADHMRLLVSVLVVDDDPQTLRYVRDTLAEAGYDPIVTGDHEKLSSIIQAERPALVLLDLLLTDTDGIEQMEVVPELADLPVIFISAYGRDETIAKALDTGAEDYLVKPFSPMELLARIRAVLRRRGDPDPFVLENLAIDYDRRLVSLAGDRVELTVTEYELLRVLSLNSGRVLSHATLIRQVWGPHGYANPKLVRTYVKKLRRKLGDDASNPMYIFNERGVGYRMAGSV